ncbi:MAG: hypothetical protein ACQEVQ_06660 [Pseudomonadota bacterium]
MANGLSTQLEQSNMISMAGQGSNDSRPNEKSDPESTFSSLLNLFIDREEEGERALESKCTYCDRGDKSSLAYSGFSNAITGIDDLTNLQKTLENALMSSIISPISSEMNTVSKNIESCSSQSGETERFLFGENGLDANDILESFNPLKNVPVISELYGNKDEREVGEFTNFLGSYLFAGNVGLAFSAADLISTKISGKTISGNIFDFTKNINFY